MKNKYVHILLPLIILSCFSSFSQEKTIEEEYAAYFSLPREALHIHLNKTTFFKGEEIWFKGYAYDQKNQLSSKATTTINVGIYDAEGKQIKKALFAAENGVTNGNFAVDSTFTAGIYYVKAETNWMKNFKENDAFIQKIEIITEETLNKEKETQKAQFDFQFLPEGGHMVANTTNTIGFKVIANNGKGVAASGIVYDQEKKQVASFESNSLGIGKFLFQPKNDTQYTAKITLENGANITKELPKVKTQGISLMLKNLFSDKIVLEFHTNEETLANHPDKTYKILIHQNGKLKTTGLQFSSTKKAISIEKEHLFKGVNTITVFDDEKQPILERLFFNDYGIKTANINVTKLTTLNDSIILSAKELNFNKNANVSISVLPEATDGYSPNHNIISNFYLKPHVRGFLENPQYYFDNMNRKKKYELDILLLTQGWSRYEWNNIFGKKPLVQHRFENGITISGRVNKPASDVKRIFLHNTKNHNAQFIDLDQNQKFELAGLFLEKEEEIRFSYVSEKGILKKPSMYLRFILNDSEDYISKDYLHTFKDFNIKNELSVPKNFDFENLEKLDAVVLEAKKKRRYEDRFLKQPKLTIITEEVVKKYDNILNFIRKNGFNEGFRGSETLDPRSFIHGSPVVFFNDQYLRPESMTVLYDLKLENIERIIIERYTDILYDGDVREGMIKIYTRETPLFARDMRNFVYLHTKTPKSFATAKEYYTPNYDSFISPVFQKYGTISWLPTVELNAEKPTSFKIYDTYTKNVTLFIEGISENGDLISERKTIKVR
ncbi:MAG: hypothetical protein AAF611_04305 [Bacteroidota bacterium]